MVFRLKKGDLIDILAPGSFIDEDENFQKGIEILKNWGLEINENNSLSKKFGYFAGDDLTRFEELEKAQNSKLIIFAKGGWGSARLLEKEPSWQHGLMLGFSDTCSLLLSKYSQGFIGSIHGPMVTGLFKEPEWSLERLRNLLFEGYVEDIRGIPLRAGKAKGEIIVSNLTIATFLIGTNHFPDCKGKGIGFGSFSNDSCDLEWKDLLKNCIIERLQEFDFPILFDLPIGHISGNACIPLGYEATLNGDDGILSIDTPF